MGPRQIADAHQELPGNLATGKKEGFFEKPDPVIFWQRVMGGDPGCKGTGRLTNDPHPSCVFDDGVHLEAVADDGGIGQQPVPLCGPIVGYLVHRKAVEGAPQALPPFQHQKPGQPGLVNFEGEALEQSRLVAERKAVFEVVIRPMERMTGSDVAIPAHDRSGRPVEIDKAAGDHPVDS